jgi:hypothetical protein
LSDDTGGGHGRVTGLAEWRPAQPTRADEQLVKNP